jgi:RND family efflux transporter MFP subunit
MKKILIALVVLVAAAFALSSFLKTTAKVAVATPGRAINAVSGSVTVKAEYQMELKSEGGGRVIASELEPGLAVTKGMVLMQIDTTDLELEIAQIESDYAARKKSLEIGSATRVNLMTARENLENYERLAESGNYPQVELERRRREVNQIEQSLALEQIANEHQLATFENTLKVKRRQLEKMTVRAPFDGVVSEVLARPGDLVGGGTPLALLISTSRTVEAKVSEENFAGVRKGQQAHVRFLGYGDELYEATVTQVLPTADPATQRYVVYLDVKIAQEKLIPGISGEVTIVVAERQADAIIPRRALFGNHVLAVENGRVELRQVKVGYVSLTAVEILEGLTTGDQVIVEELDLFRDGDRVKVETVSAN